MAGNHLTITIHFVLIMIVFDYKILTLVIDNHCQVKPFSLI